MALTQIAFGALGAGSQNGTDMPVIQFDTVTVCTGITPSGSSQTSSAAAPAGTPTRCARVATDAPIYVTFGTSPTATATNGLFIPAGGVEYISVPAGYFAAVLAA